MSLISSFKYRFYKSQPQLIKKHYSGLGHIFMLHRILPKEEKEQYEFNKTLAITPEGLEKFILKFKEQGFNFISMNEFSEQIKSKSNKKFIVFTIDDGYKDNLIHGLPIFEKHNVPFTLYVSNCFPNNQAIYWWYFLEDFVKSNKVIDLRGIGIDYCESIIDPSTTFYKVRELLRISDYDVHKKFAKDICQINNHELLHLNKKLNLTWNEIKSLSQNILVEIGGHTMHHVSLNYLSEKQSGNQILDSKNELERQIDKPVNHFAFPYGSLDDASAKEYKLLTKFGFKSAVYNHPGGIYKNTPSYQFPRLGLSDETTLSRLNQFFSGQLHLNFNGLNKTIG